VTGVQTCALPISDTDTDTGGGEEVEDVESLEGNGYAIEFKDMEWRKPNSTVIGLIEDYGGEIPIEWFALQVFGADPSVPELDMVAAVAVLNRGTIHEEACYPLADAGEPVPFTSNPDFVTPAVDIPYALPDLGVTLEIEEFQFAGTFEADGSNLLDVTATGIIDTAPLSKLAGTDICLVAGLAGNPCVACPGGGTTCLDVELYAAQVPLDARVDIDRSYDWTTDPDCDTGS